MDLLEIKCFMLNLLGEIYQLRLTWLYITRKHIHNLDEGFPWK